MLKTPGRVKLQEWNQQVLQLGLGDTSSYTHEERRLISDSNSRYNLYIYNANNSKLVLINNFSKDFEKPGFETRNFIVSSAGTTVYFLEPFISSPMPQCTAVDGPLIPRVTNITTTSVKVYVYDCNGNLSSGRVILSVFGERA